MYKPGHENYYNDKQFVYIMIMLNKAYRSKVHIYCNDIFYIFNRNKETAYYEQRSLV